MEAIDDHPANDGMIRVDGVPGTTVVGVKRTVVFENVVGAVLQPAKTQRWPVLVAFGGVIENHVEDDLDARPVEGFHHVAKFMYRAKRILT